MDEGTFLWLPFGKLFHIFQRPAPLAVIPACSVYIALAAWALAFTGMLHSLIAPR